MNQIPNQEQTRVLADHDPALQSSRGANFSHPMPPSRGKFWQHKFFWILVVLLAAALYFGGQLLYKNITGGVNYELPDWLASQLSPLDNGSASIEELKNRDTDQDGLNDYQEIYQFHTSIFLEDSDSDGISDLTEVSAGDDPLCPRGQDCNLLKLVTPNTKLGEVIRDVQVDQNITLQDAALSEFRKFLIENGMTQTEVNQLSDDDLIAIFSAIDESQPNEQVGLANDASADEVKQFLLGQQGADADQINSMSDEQLLQIRDTLVNLGSR